MEAVTLIKERRSITFFDAGYELAKDKLKELLDLANLAPSSMNMQPWRVISVMSAERKKILRAAASNQPKVEDASAVLIIVADPALFEKNIDGVLSDRVKLGYMKEEAKERTTSGALKLYGEPDSTRRKIWAVKNAALFAMSVMFAAKALGLESHPMDGFDEGKIKQEFGIEERCIIPMLIAVGRMNPGANLLPRAMRRSINEFVSFE
jgi:putative NAD(P)H nitroreductase